MLKLKKLLMMVMNFAATFFYSMSWNFRIALPGISDRANFCTTSEASSAGKTEWGGGWISLVATSRTSSCNCSMVPVGTGSMCCLRSSALRANFGSSFSATSSLISTTPPSFKHWSDLCRERDVVPKSITTSTRPLHALWVRSINCFSYKSSFHWTTFTLKIWK